MNHFLLAPSPLARPPLGRRVAHVTLPPGGAAAGSDYEAAFRVGHSCKDTRSTTGITVRLPDGFSVQKAEPRPGWTLAASPGRSPGGADSAPSALPAAERAEFIVRGTLTAKPGTLWFKVLQSCDAAAPTGPRCPRPPSDKLAFPAARLEVLAAGVAAVDVRDAWVRSRSGPERHRRLHDAGGAVRARLTGVATPVAGVAEVHEMKMEGDTDAHARTRRMACAARAADGGAQARWLPRHADGPEAAAGRRARRCR